MRVPFHARMLAAMASLLIVPVPSAHADEHHSRKEPAKEVTVVGCVVREKDFRKLHHEGKGGPMQTGIGLSDEYVLVNATRVTSEAGPSTRNSCSPESWGEVFELTGFAEKRAKPFVGHWVEVVGKQKAGEPTKRFSINVYAVHDYVPLPAGLQAPPADRQPPATSR